MIDYLMMINASYKYISISVCWLQDPQRRLQQEAEEAEEEVGGQEGGGHYGRGHRGQQRRGGEEGPLRQSQG